MSLDSVSKSNSMHTVWSQMHNRIDSPLLNNQATVIHHEVLTLVPMMNFVIINFPQRLINLRVEVHHELFALITWSSTGGTCQLGPTECNASSTFIKTPLVERSPCLSYHVELLQETVAETQQKHMTYKTSCQLD